MMKSMHTSYSEPLFFSSSNRNFTFHGMTRESMDVRVTLCSLGGLYEWITAIGSKP